MARSLVTPRRNRDTKKSALLEPKTHARIKRLADKKGLKLSSAIDQAINDYCEKEENAQ